MDFEAAACCTWGYYSSADLAPAAEIEAFRRGEVTLFPLQRHELTALARAELSSPAQQLLRGSLPLRAGQAAPAALMRIATVSRPRATAKRPARRALILAAFAAACSSGAVACAPPSARDASAEEGPTDWNAAQIDWREYHAGLSEARAQRKPIVLIFYTDWCPHCHNYSRVFYDPQLVLLSRSFVMIRVERDSNPELSARYALDGEYVPRTFFLTESGELRAELTGDNPDFRYFLDEDDPSELMALMQRARGG